MGWSSWNSFRVKIDERLIREQADAMISSGLYDAGYRYINSSVNCWRVEYITHRSYEVFW